MQYKMQKNPTLQSWIFISLSLSFLGLFGFIPFHRFPKAGIGTVSYVLGNLLKRCIFRLHQLVCDTHTYSNKFLSKAFSRILQNQSFCMTFGNVKLLGKVGKINVFVIVEDEKFADEEIIILYFRYRVMLLMILVAKQRDIKCNCTVVPR